MPFLDNLSKKVGDAAKSAAKKSSELVEVTKLNRAISSEEENIDKVYLEIGKNVYGKFQNGQTFEDDINELCQKIAEFNGNIDSLRQKILEIKNQRLCPNCKNEIAEGTMFCSKCGTKIEIQQPVEESVQEVEAQFVPIQESEGKICPSCGNKSAEGTMFCGSCGSKLV